MPHILQKLRDEIEEGIGDGKTLSANELSKVLSDLDSSIRSKMIGQVFDIDTKAFDEKYKSPLQLEDYSTLDELWAVCTQEGDSRIGEATSDAKTIDLLEVSDEASCRSKTLSILTLIFEMWQAARQSAKTAIDRRSQKSDMQPNDSSLKQQVNLLYWGKEVKMF